MDEENSAGICFDPRIKSGTLFTSEMPMTKAMYGPIKDLRWAGVQWMQELLAAYEKVYPNLSKNAKNYPSPNYLKGLVKVGNIDFEGETVIRNGKIRLNHSLQDLLNARHQSRRHKRYIFDLINF
jgi:hypothetical protein